MAPPESVCWGVLTNRTGKVVEEGTEYVHFFPDGTAEKAFVWLSDGTDTYTIEVKSLQGTGVFHKEELSEADFKKK